MKTPDTERFEREDGAHGLDAFFAAARSDARLPTDLAARMVRDADGMHRSRTPNRPGRWAQLRDVLGGWYGMGGLVAACAAGVWMGFAPPAGLPDAVSLFAGQDSTAELYLSESFAMAMAEDG